MQQCNIIYWCGLLFLIGSSSGFFLRHMKSSKGTGFRIDLSKIQARLQEQGNKWNKRSGYYGIFTNSVSQYASVYSNKHVFMETMFQLFDVNSDQCIDKREFKAILELIIV